MAMQACITGANGFIGQSIVTALYRQGFSIRVLTRRPDCSFPDGIQVVRGDLSTPDCPVEKFLMGCEIVFHCAGEIHDISSMQSLHVDGTQYLLQAVLKESAKNQKKIHWVQLSSVGVYGRPEGGTYRDRIVTENTYPCPIGEYETTKAMADDLVIQASNAGLMTYSILRPSNVFGEMMPNQSLRGLVSMVKRGLFFYIGEPGAIATYIHVDDVTTAMMECALNPKARGRIYNLSNDCLLEDLIKHIASILGVRSPWMRVPETLARNAVGIFEGRMNIPLTQSRIDALINNTRYPADKIISELGFRFTKPMPTSVEELIKKNS